MGNAHAAVWERAPLQKGKHVKRNTKTAAFALVLAGIGGTHAAQAQNCNNSTSCVSSTQSGIGYAIYAATTGGNAAVFANGATGSGYGVVANGLVGLSASSTSLTGFAVQASNSGGTAVYATTNANASALYGEADANTAFPTAVVGRVCASGTGGGCTPGQGAAIYGDNNTASGYAGYFHGNVYATVRSRGIPMHGSRPISNPLMALSN